MEIGHSDSELEDLRLPPSTTRLLYSSLPFDSGKAILFLPEKGITEDGPEENKKERERVRELSGHEAKQFYEEVLLMPQESKGTDSSQTIEQPLARPKNKKRNHKHRTHKERRRKDHSEHYTVGQMFQFAQEGDLECLKSGLTSGQFDVNMVDNFNWTLLMTASHAGHMAIVQFLLSFGAQWESITDRSGKNAADLARITGHHDVAECIENATDYHLSNSDKKRLKLKDMHEDDTSDSGNLSLEQTYFCDICKMRVSDSGVGNKHNTSTLHQFSCQHQPNVTSYGITESNRGFQMLLKGGWNPEKGLGSGQQGPKFPVKTILKQDRLGFGLKSSSSKPRVTHFSAHDEDAVKTHSQRGQASEDKVQTKKDIVRDAVKDKRWEIRMRQYMNSDY